MAFWLELHIEMLEINSKRYKNPSAALHYRIRSFGSNWSKSGTNVRIKFRPILSITQKDNANEIQNASRKQANVSPPASRDPMTSIQYFNCFSFLFLLTQQAPNTEEYAELNIVLQMKAAGMKIIFSRGINVSIEWHN